MHSTPVTRFAPSPTGFLHIGGARTALLNWIYAKRYGGKFLLRIEDTDKERSDPALSKKIIEAMDWLGISPDEPPVYQSQRFEQYRLTADRLLEAGSVYPCFCSQQELSERAGEKKGWKYDRQCLDLPPDEVRARREKGDTFVLRFKVDRNRTIEFKDGIRKRVKVKGEQIEDFIIVRSDGSPTYNLAVVVDDHEMGINTVMRGEDHLTNTAKQILLYEALGWELPAYFHLPLIHGEDGTKLSKRHGSVDTLEYREQGYLAGAMVNYLSRLGWTPPDTDETLTLKQLAERFETRDLNRSASRFSIKKLTSINAKWISITSAKELLKILVGKPAFQNLVEELSEERVLAGIDLVKSRCHLIPDFYEKAGYAFRDPERFEPEAVEKVWSPLARDRLKILLKELEQHEDFSEESLETLIRSVADRLGVKHGELIHPLRVALTGTRVSPGIFELIRFFGKEAVLRRIRYALEKLP